MNINLTYWESNPLTENFQIILLIFLLSLLFKFIVDKFRRNGKFLKAAASLPGPPEWPLIGNGIAFIFPGKDGMRGLQRKLYKKYGSIYRLWFGKQLWISVSDPEDLNAIFNGSHAVNRPHVIESFHDFFGEGSFGTQDLDTWKANRKIMQPFLTRNAIKSHVPQMNGIIYEFIEDIKNYENTCQPDMTNFCTEPIVKILCKTLFGYDIKSIEVTRLNPLRMQQRVLRILIGQLFVPLLRLKYIKYFFDKICIYRVKKKLYNLFEKVIKNHHNLQENESDIPSATLLEGFSEVLSEEDVKEKLISIVFPGFSAPSRTVAFAVWMMAVYPEIQQKLYQDIQEVFGDDDRHPDVDDIENLTYLDQVIKETERRFTSITLLFRELAKETVVGSHTFPVGTGFLINLANINFNPTYFPNPHVFNPDNFNPEAVANRPKYTFIPFGAGQRMCPGKDLAEIEIKLIIIALLRTFKLQSSMKIEDIQLMHSYVTTIPKSFHIKFELRDSKTVEKSK